MGRPRKPLELATLDGSAQHNPARYEERQNMPKPDADIGDPPKHLTPTQKKIWYEFVDICATGLLTCQDRPALELLVIGMGRCRHGWFEKNLKGKRVKKNATEVDRERVMKRLAAFGMTPVARSHVSIEKQTVPDEGFGEL